MDAVCKTHLQSAGADDLELNLFSLPLNFVRSSEETGKIYFEIVEQIKREGSIPIALSARSDSRVSNIGQCILEASLSLR